MCISWGRELRGDHQGPLRIRIGGEEVAWVEGVRFLGMWVVRGLDWPHTEGGGEGSPDVGDNGEG